MRNDEETGDIILSRKPIDWDSFFRLIDGAPAPADFLDCAKRSQMDQDRDPFEGRTE